MADSTIPVTPGAGSNVDTRTEATNGQHRQVVVIGDPSVNNNVGAVASQDIAPSDQTTPGVVVRSAGSLAINIVGAQGTVGVHIQSTGGTLQVKQDPDGTLGGIRTTVRIYLENTAGTLQVKTDPDSTLGGIRNTIRVYLENTAGTLQVKTDPDSTLGGIRNTIRIYLENTAGTLQVKTDPDSTIGGIRNTIRVYIENTAGTLNVKLDPSYAVINDSSTLTIQQSVSGSANGVSVSGNTIKAPVTSRVIKVYAIALTTTAQVGIVAKVTNGAGTGPTEYWRYALQAPSQGIAGANISVAPPSYLFAIASGQTLALVLDSASLVHYSFGYFLESA